MKGLGTLMTVMADSQLWLRSRSRCAATGSGSTCSCCQSASLQAEPGLRGALLYGPGMHDSSAKRLAHRCSIATRASPSTSAVDEHPHLRTVKLEPHVWSAVGDRHLQLSAPVHRGGAECSSA